MVNHGCELELTRPVNLVVAGGDILGMNFAVLYVSKNVLQSQAITHKYLLIS
jgi:hypothetical protein